MSALLTTYFDNYLVFLLVLTRVGALVMTAPIFGSQSAPMRIRVFLAIGLALVVAPVQFGELTERPGDLIHLLLMAGREMTIGLSLGLATLILFSGLQISGQIIGQMSGMSLADVFDPAFDANIPIFAQLLQQLTLAVFMIIGGHRQVVDALLMSFYRTPPGGAASLPGVTAALTEIATQSFLVGIRVAAPMMVALLMSVLIMGLISRTLPQLNVMVVGFTFNSLVMMLALMVSISSVVWIIHDSTPEMLDIIHGALTPSPDGQLQPR